VRKVVRKLNQGEFKIIVGYFYENQKEKINKKGLS